MMDCLAPVNLTVLEKDYVKAVSLLFKEETLHIHYPVVTSIFSSLKSLIEEGDSFKIPFSLGTFYTRTNNLGDRQLLFKGSTSSKQHKFTSNVKLHNTL